MKKLFSEIPLLKGERLTLKKLTYSDSDGLRKLTDSPLVYRYLPTFLFEKKYDSKEYVIGHLYDECLEQSLILGVFLGNEFCGLAEIYSYQAPLLKASVGYRLLQKYWGMGIATEALSLMVEYLLNETNVRIITASTMLENKASANVLKKNGFKRFAHAVYEDWGFGSLTLTDKWIRTKAGYLAENYLRKKTLGG